MNISDPIQLLQLLHITDSAFPTGAFSHSYGLEAYTQAAIVHDAGTLRDYLSGRLLAGMAQFDLVFLREALLAAQARDMGFVSSLDERLSAMMTVYELREASMQVGRRFLRTSLPLYGGATARHYFEAIQQKQCSGHFAIAYGIVLGEMGISSEAALLACVHAFVMGQAAAAVKLLNLGQTQVQGLIVDMQPVIQETVKKSLACALGDCRMFTPALDIRAMQHEYLFRRLFIS